MAKTKRATAANPPATEERLMEQLRQPGHPLLLHPLSPELLASTRHGSSPKENSQRKSPIKPTLHRTDSVLRSRRKELNCEFLAATTSVTLGVGGGLTELVYVGFGFTYTHRAVFDRMFEQLKLPLCNQGTGHSLVPFFAPSAVRNGMDGGWTYLAEDYSFCSRARQVNIPVLADTSLRLWRVGPYCYG